MPRVTCRCGQALTIPAGGAEWVACSGCGAKLRVRAKPAAAPPASPAAGDGFIRFRCDCGKRLKVESANPPAHGQCPACGAVVPVPAAGASAVAPVPAPAQGPGSRTAEMTVADRTRLEAWARAHSQKTAPADPASSDIPSPSESALPASAFPPPPPPTTARTEAGLRLCPSCRKPVHLGADVCRHCGTPVPKR